MKLSEQSKIATELMSLLQKSEGPYRRALSIIEAFEDASRVDADGISQCMLMLEPHMQQVQEIETTLAPCRKKWLELNVKPDVQLQKVFAEHQEILGTLIQKISFLEQHAQQIKKSTVTTLDNFVRHQQMQKAYQQHRR